jgi:hypothetical protein
VAAATAAGRNFRRCLRAHLLNLAERVSQPDAQKTVVLTARRAVQLQKGAATVQKAVAMVDPLVPRLT